MSEQFDKVVFFTLYQSAYDNRVLDRNRFDVPWGDLVEMLLTEHQFVRHKNEVKLIAPVRFLDRDAPGCQYATYTEHEEKNGLGKQGEIKYDEEGHPCVWRAATNVEAWSMLPVDIDGEQTITEAKAFFREYTYVAYTSFNHLKDERTEKFRLFLPLEQPVSHTDFKNRLPAVKAWLGNVDVTSLASARGFYLPSCPRERKDKARRWYHEGRCLDLQAFKVKTKTAPTRPPYAAKVSDADVPEEMRQLLLDQLRGVYLGHYDEWWKVSSAMVSAGFTLADFEYVTINGMMSEKDARDCQRQWDKAVARHHRGTSINPGYLYHLVGGLKALKRIKLEKEIEELNNLLGNES
jgi:hypothetical protein